jgi:uncharacterized protein YktA (UPF0223 family)
MSRETKFRKEWLKKCLPSENGKTCAEWLVCDSSDELIGFCNLCQKSFHLGTSGFGAVSSHAIGKLHRQAFSRRFSDLPSVDQFFKPEVSVKSQEENGVMRAEMRWALHFLEHNLAFEGAEHSGVLKEMFPDSKIARNIKCHRNKMSYLINDAWSVGILQTVVADLKSQGSYYSLSVDESNDVLGSRKFLQIVLSYFSINHKRILVLPLQTVQIDDGTAETLEKAVISSLCKLDIPLQKCACIMSDGPQVMIGRHNGFHVRMLRHIPHLLSLGTCSLHHVSNAVKGACQALGGMTESFADNLFAYFHSTSRWSLYQQVQSLLEVAKHRFQRRVEIR